MFCCINNLNFLFQFMECENFRKEFYKRVRPIQTTLWVVVIELQRDKAVRRCRRFK